MVRKMYPNKVRAVKNQSYKFLMSLASLAQTNHDRGEADRDTIIGRYMSATYPMGLRTTWEPNARGQLWSHRPDLCGTFCLSRV